MFIVSEWKCQKVLTVFLRKTVFRYTVFEILLVLYQTTVGVVICKYINLNKNKNRNRFCHKQLS